MLNFKTKVLIIDDLVPMRMIVRTLLRQIGFEHIEEADDGEQALQILQADKDFGLVLSDWIMPVMDGVDLLRKVRSDHNLKDLPFILITAEVEKKKIIEAIKAGVDIYIVKPLTEDILREKLKKLAHKRPSLRQP
jgi:two-component system chemotaxis response regulator CheY